MLYGLRLTINYNMHLPKPFSQLLYVCVFPPKPQDHDKSVKDIHAIISSRSICSMPIDLTDGWRKETVYIVQLGEFKGERHI